MNYNDILEGWSHLHTLSQHGHLTLSTYIETQDFDGETYYYLPFDLTPNVLYEAGTDRHGNPYVTGYVRIYPTTDPDFMDDEYQYLEVQPEWADNQEGGQQ